MSKVRQISAAVLLIVLMLWANASEGRESLTSAELISQTELMLILPADADLQNIRRQQKAFKKGFYWTKNKTLRPLDNKS